MPPVPSPVPAGTERAIAEALRWRHWPYSFQTDDPERRGEITCGCGWEHSGREDDLTDWADHIAAALAAVVSSSPATPACICGHSRDVHCVSGCCCMPADGFCGCKAFGPSPASPAETREGREGAWAKMADMARHHVSALREAADSIDEANGRTPDGFDIAHASSWLRARADEIDPDPDDQESPLMRAAAALMERWPHRYDETGGHVHIDAEDPRTVAAVVLAAASPAVSLPGEAEKP